MSGGAFDRLYRIKRGDVVFHALVTGPDRGRRFREIKKSRDSLNLETDRFMVAALNCIAYLARRGEFDIITTPPESGKEESFAGFAAKMVSVRAGIDYVKFFREHGRGKRKYLREKFEDIPFDLVKRPAGARVLVFDDFAHTGRTMVGSIEALQSVGADVEGVVLCA